MVLAGMKVAVKSVKGDSEASNVGEVKNLVEEKQLSDVLNLAVPAATDRIILKTSATQTNQGQYLITIFLQDKGEKRI